MNKKMVFILVLLMAAGAQAGYAKVSLNPDFTGTVMVTFPDGKVLMLGPGDTIPEISSDSKLEVFDGHMQVTTENGDHVTAACAGNEAGVGGGASVDLACGEKKASLKVLDGTITLKDSEGKSSELKKGDEQNLTLGAAAEKLKAPETSAGQETGSPTNSGIPPVDSRSIEASTSN